MDDPTAIPILMVDDRPENLTALEAVLDGMELPTGPIRALSGNEALRLLLRQDVALILLDVQMPEMNGFETAELIRSNPRTAHIPIIFVTAGVRDVDHQFKGYSAGAVDYLTKPIEPAILRGKAKVFCELYRQRKALEELERSQEALVEERTRALRQEVQEHQEAEAQLEETRANLTALIESSTDFIWSVDCRERLLTFNSNLATFLRRTHGTDPSLGMPCDQLLPPDRARMWTGLYQRAFREGPYRIELPGADGQLFEMSFHPIRRGAQVTGVSVYGKDITRRRRAEQEKARIAEQLHQSQKMDGIGQLAGGIAHDFNNILSGIISVSELLLAPDTELPEARRTAYLEMILAQARSAADLTGKLLAFARKGPRTTGPVDVLRVVSDTAEILRHTIDKRIQVTVESRAAGTWVEGDSSMFQSVFMNMGINASHAMPGGGHLEFRLAETDLDEAACAGSPFQVRPGRFLEIEVRDSGCGMSPEVLARIFEPFFTTKPAGQGTGLGLAAAYGAVRDHGGAIGVRSEPGAGTSFRIYLPLGCGLAPASGSGPGPAAGTGTLLLGDDDEFIRVTTKARLEDLGFAVLLAADGVEAVERFQEVHDQLGLVILDLQMPRLGGAEAFLRMRELDPAVPIFLASGSGEEDQVAGLLHGGLAGFLAKPFQAVELSAALALARRIPEPVRAGRRTGSDTPT
jgi:signal transduction histidine kinase